jgi:hypothetical protein
MSGNLPKLKSVILERDEARRFSQIWRRLNDGPNVACFSPAYEVAFYSNNTLQLTIPSLVSTARRSLCRTQMDLKKYLSMRRDRQVEPC